MIPCICGNYFPYDPVGIVAPIQPIGSCINCFSTIHVNFKDNPKNLFSGRRQGQEDAIDTNSSTRFILYAREDQVITSSYFIGFFGETLLRIGSFTTHMSEFTNLELDRAIRRAKRKYSSNPPSSLI